MCRFIAYRGNSTYLADLLIRPSNSLLLQSQHARESKEPLNGDGFGVGWYTPGEDPTPCVFTSVTPAWSNRNLRRLAVRIRSEQFFAHVRSATPGMTVNEQNCHPFRCGRFLWMHNGRIAGFPSVRRALLAGVRDDLFARLQGTTDSEHAFLVFLDCLTPWRESASRRLLEQPEVLERYREQFFEPLARPSDVGLDDAGYLDRVVEHLGEFPPEVIEGAVHQTIARLESLTRAAGVADPSFYNFAVTDGRTLVVSRCADRLGEPPPSLYVAGHVLVPEGAVNAVPQLVVSSEPLDDVHDDWREIPANHVLRVDPDWRVWLNPLSANLAA